MAKANRRARAFLPLLQQLEPGTPSASNATISPSRIAVGLLGVLALAGLVHQVSDWGSGVAIKMGRRSGGCRAAAGRDEGAYLNRYVIWQLPDHRPIFIATLRAARLLAGCFVAHRSRTTAGILPLRSSSQNTQQRHYSSH
jgi:hypothetical protein